MAPTTGDWLDINKLLQSYQDSLSLKATGLSSGSRVDPARQLLLNTKVNWMTSPEGGSLTGKTNRGGPGVLSRILDVVSRPRYAVAEATRQLASTPDTGDNILEQTGDVLGGAISGLAGTKKTSWQDVIKEKVYQDNQAIFQPPKNPNDYKRLLPEYKGTAGAKQAKVAGIAGDILLDPINLIGAGAVRGVGRALGIKPKPSSLSEVPRMGGTASSNVLPVNPNVFPTPAPSSIPESISLPSLSQGAVTSNLFTPQVSPRVTIPNQTGLGQTNAQIKANIQAIASAAGIREVPRLSKLTKPQLVQVLEDIRKAQGTKALGEITKGAPLPVPTSSALGENLVEQVAQTGSKIDRPAEVAKLVDDYERNVLSRPNQFPKLGQPVKNNPAQQVNFFNNHIVPKVRELYPKRNARARNTIALGMLREAENAFEAKGLGPAFWSGTPVKLSQVIEKIGVPKKVHLTQVMTAIGNRNASKIKDPQVRAAVEGVISAQKLSEIPYAQQVVDQTLDTAAVAKATMSEPKFYEFAKNLEKNAAKQADFKKNPIPNVDFSDVRMPIPAGRKPFGTGQVTRAGTPSMQALAGVQAGKLVKDTLSQLSPPWQIAYTRNAPKLQSYISSPSGKVSWAPINNAVTNAIHSTMGGPTPAQLGKIVGSENRAVDWFLARFSTAYGNADLRPEVLIATQTARQKAVLRSKVLNNVARNFTDTQIDEAWNAVRGTNIGGQTENIQNLSNNFSKIMDNLFGGTGLKADAHSTAYRSGIVMSELNKQLNNVKAGFQFTNKKKVNWNGQALDFSAPGAWLQSWKTFSPNDPLVFMSKLQTAVENTVAKNTFLDEVSSRFGSTNYSRKMGYTHRVNDPRFKDYYFPEEIANQMAKALKTWDQIYDPKSQLTRLLDSVTSMWKTGMTIYMPAHHIRNMIGDTYLSWMDGVNSPAVYNKAIKVLSSQKDRYKDIDSVEDLVSNRAISAALTRPGDRILRTKSGIDLTAEQVYTLAFNKGLLQSANVVEDILTDTVPKLKPFGGKVSGWVRGKTEAREHFVRLAHFIDKLQKSNIKNVDEAATEASKSVRKWHPDGQDLTEWERTYMRRVFPFYSWTRKSIPLLIESAVVNPGKTALYPKAMYGLQQLTGTEGASISDPFPEDQLFPDWIKEKGIGPIAAHGMDGIPGIIAGVSRSRTGFSGEPEGYTVANPSNPFIDTVAQFAGMGNPSDPIRGIASMVNPLGRVPAEVGTGHTVLGTPVDYDPNKYATENIPLLAYLSQIGNIGLFGPTRRGEQEGIFNEEGFLNWLTALGVRGTGANIKQAEYEARERAKRGE